MTDSTRKQLEELYAAQAEDIGAAMLAASNEEDHEGQDAQDYLNEICYGITHEAKVILTLAGGGPAAWVEVSLRRDGGPWWEAYAAKWRGAWWGPVIEHELEIDDNGMGQWAASEAEAYMEYSQGGEA